MPVKIFTTILPGIFIKARKHEPGDLNSDICVRDIGPDFPGKFFTKSHARKLYFHNPLNKRVTK